MIKSFFKRVFSSSSETVATTEQAVDADEQDVVEAFDKEPEANGNIDTEDDRFESLTLRKEWLDPPSFYHINRMVASLYERAEQSPEKSPSRLRLELDENLREVDLLTAKRLSKFLSLAEQEIVDLTFLLDKSDPETMNIYRERLLPERIEHLNAFLQERCLMIYETSAALKQDYKMEIEQFFQALGLDITPTFFDEFEKWRQEILRRHEEEQLSEGNTEDETDQALTMIKISREEVENENIQQIDQYLKQALQTPETAKAMKETLLFSFYGFSEHEDLFKLMNRKDVNDWASLLVEKHPYIFYFLNNSEYPMTQFLTSLVVTTEVEDQYVYYNDDELIAFKAYISEALEKLSQWVEENQAEVVEQFTSCFK